MLSQMPSQMLSQMLGQPLGHILGQMPSQILSQIISQIPAFLTYLCLGVGVVFWFWGTSYLLGRRSVLYKLHSLSVADTLGSIAILVGLLFQRPREWPLLLLGIICLTIWNTMLGYVMAYCSNSGEPVHDSAE